MKGLASKPASAAQSNSPFRSRGSKNSVIQTKLQVNKPGDAHEVEADQAAEKLVVQTKSDGKSPAKPPAISQTITPLQRKEEEASTQGENVQAKEDLQKKEDVQLKETEIASMGMPSSAGEKDPIRAAIQRKEDDLQAKELTAAPASPLATTPIDQKLHASKGSGSPLPTAVKSEMESGFGADFSSVQVHTGSQAQAMNKEIGAQAFTHKNDIYFNQGKYDPESMEGKKLLAHELTHTIQQGAATEKKKEINLLEVNTPKEQQAVMVSTSEVADGKALEGQNYNAEAVSNIIKQDVNTKKNVTNGAGEVTETSNVTGLEKIEILDNPGSQKVNERTKKEKDQKKEEPSLNEFKKDPFPIDIKQFKLSNQDQVTESKTDQSEPITTDPNISSQKNSLEQESNKDGKTDTGALLKTDTKEPVGASQQEEEMEETPTEQGSLTPKESSASVVESEPDQVQEIDAEVQEGTEIGEEDIQQDDAEQETTIENVSDLANETIIHLEDLEKSHSDSLSAYRRITQKNIRTLKQQSEKALQSCDSTYYQQVGLIENGYGNAIRKVKKALSTTLSDLSKGKSARRKKLTSIVENKVKKTGYLTWNKQQQAEGMGREFSNKTWTYTTELKNDSNKKAYDQKQEIKANGADAKRKYINHKYKPDVDEAVDESVLDYCETINESTADLKATLNEDAGGMATNFKNEASDLKALLPQGKQRVIQNIQAIGREGAKEFNKVDQDVLPTLRKQMYAAEAELHQARKQALIALKNTWMQTRQGIKEQQKQLELKLRTSEKQAVAENTEVMAEVRAEYSQDPTMESQLAEMDTQMKKSPGELATAQQNLLKQAGVERQKGVRLARQGMTILGSGSVKQAQKMADTATNGATKMKAGALKGYDQVVKGTENGMNDELSRYEQSLDKIIGDARSDWRKKLGEGKWGMRKKAHEVWYENGKLRKESRSELFAVAKDASEVDFWDVLQAIGYFLAGVLAVLLLILAVVAVVWLLGALLGYLGGVLMALIGETLLGAILSLLGTLLKAGIVLLLKSTIFWVGASVYGIITGIERINAAKNNPYLTRNQTAYEYGFGTGEIVTSLLPAWFKFKGKVKSQPPKSTPKPTYQNHGGEFEDDFARMGTQQEPPMNKPSGSNKPLRDAEDFAGNKKSDKFVEEGSLNREAAELASGWQGKGAYTGVDSWRNITLADGKNVIGGLPGQSNYYTTLSGLNRSGLNQTSLFEGLQVAKHPQFGYRGQVGIYKVVGNTSAAFGTTYANPQFGEGGLPQIFIPDYSGLQLIKIIQLK